jgi:hypothetical protein
MGKKSFPESIDFLEEYETIKDGFESKPGLPGAFKSDTKCAGIVDAPPYDDDEDDDE